MFTGSGPITRDQHAFIKGHTRGHTPAAVTNAGLQHCAQNGCFSKAIGGRFSVAELERWPRDGRILGAFMNCARRARGKWVAD